MANRSYNYFLLLLFLAFPIGKAFAADRLPNAFTEFLGVATYCQGDTPTDLSVTFSTCKFGQGPQSDFPITVTWFSNTTNSTSGGTQEAQTNSTTGTTTYIYTPSTGDVGTTYYYVEISWAGGGDCGGPSPLSTSTFAPSTIEVIVNPPAPATPGPISGSSSVAPSISGLTYSISSVIDATSYTWTVPSGWTIDSGDGTISISATSGTTGGDITVTADNSCGSSTPQTLAVTITASPPTITLGANPSVVEGTTSADLPYTATTNSPDQYNIDYDATAEGQGFVDVTLAALPASPIVLTVPGAATPATYNGMLTVRNSGSGLTSGDYAITVTITPGTPTITITDPNPSVVQGVTSANIPYSATTYSPDQYSIDYDATAEGQGFVDVTLAALPASPIVLIVPGAAAEDTYNGTLTVRNSSTGEVSGNYAITVTVTGAASPPTITLGANPSVVEGTTSADLPYTATTNSPDQYNIDYDATAEGQGFVDVTLAALPASPIVLTVPGAATPATYNGTLTVRNSSSGLTSGDYAITVTITPGIPTITITDPNPSVVQGVTSANIPYSTTTYSPDQYNIDYDATAEGQGFVDVTLAALPASPIVLIVPGAAAEDTYNGTLTVRNSSTGELSGNYAITVTVTTSALPPTITLGANPTVCQGTTSANLTYSATTESPDQYSVDYSAAAEAEGFVDVVDASLPASPISLTVPGGAATGTYDGNLTVRNSGSGLSSGNYPISVTVNTTPAVPGFIFGSTSVEESTADLVYSIVAVPSATTYTWTVPSGWVITAGQGTTSITVTSGTAGQNGNITVTAGNSCGTSAAATLGVTSEAPSDHSIYGCNACHITHDALGGSLTNTLGNSNLCLSCHVSTGAASAKPFTNADKAIPGTSGNSHAWDVASVNSTYETVLTTDPGMLLRIDGGNIICSTCHDQHNTNLNINYTRVSNAGDFMCKDCHEPRDVGRYMDDPINNKGSHPVGLTYSGTGDLEPVPTGSAIVVGGKIECSSCHQTHYAFTDDGMLLRQTNDDALCKSCHTLFNSGGTPVGTHNGMSCNDCHQTHNTDKSNIFMIRNTIAIPSSGNKTVVFTDTIGSNSFADGDATYDGICEVCHTTTIHYQNDGTASDQDHTSSGGPMDGQNCTSCHPHNANFAPQGCVDCHTANYPGWGTTDNHATHAIRYNYSCSTCHLNYGQGGSLEGSHPNSTVNTNFDSAGMATRNGNDAITPVLNGDKTCDNMYCHSNGRSAYRGTDGTYIWSGTTGSQTAVYATTPAWSTTGTITTCIPCHSGTGNMTDPYTITTPGLADPLPPATGSHRRGAHVSNSQELSGNGWDVVNCFWCHNAADGDDGSPILQGTYGTSFHVDGTTFFDPRSVIDGGTTVNNTTGGSFSYSLLGSSAHCGDGKTCW